MVDEMQLGYPVLVDPDLAVIRAYGVLNEVMPRVPHPTVVIVDRSGIVRFVHLDEDYRRRPPVEILLRALEGLER